MSTITFDDVHNHKHVIPDGYQGYDWQNFYLVGDTSRSKYDNTGYQNGTTSGHGVAWMPDGSDNGVQSRIYDPNGTFNVLSMKLTAVDDISGYHVFGLRNGETVYSTSNLMEAHENHPTTLTLNWQNIDTFVFDVQGDSLVIDDLQLTQFQSSAVNSSHADQFVDSRLHVQHTLIPLHGAEHLAIA